MRNFVQYLLYSGLLKTADFFLNRSNHSGVQPISTINGLQDTLDGIIDHEHAWGEIQSTPTTLAGYGITDALPLAGGTMDADASVGFNNGSSLHEGGFGIELECSANYRLRWMDGVLYTLEQNGTTIRTASYAQYAPGVNEDVDHGFTVTSTWTMEDGTVYAYTNNSSGAAIWVRQGPSVDVAWIKLDANGEISTVGSPSRPFPSLQYAYNAGARAFRFLDNEGYQLTNPINSGTLAFYAEDISPTVSIEWTGANGGAGTNGDNYQLPDLNGGSGGSGDAGESLGPFLLTIYSSTNILFDIIAVTPGAGGNGGSGGYGEVNEGVGGNGGDGGIGGNTEGLIYFYNCRINSLTTSEGSGGDGGSAGSGVTPGFDGSQGSIGQNELNLVLHNSIVTTLYPPGNAIGFNSVINGLSTERANEAIDWEDINNIPSTFPPSTHTHPEYEISIDLTAWVQATGNDGTAQLGNPAKPYQTVNAAVSAGALQLNLGPNNFGFNLDNDTAYDLVFRGVGRSYSSVVINLIGQVGANGSPGVDAEVGSNLDGGPGGDGSNGETIIANLLIHSDMSVDIKFNFEGGTGGAGGSGGAGDGVPGPSGNDGSLGSVEGNITLFGCFTSSMSFYGDFVTLEGFVYQSVITTTNPELFTGYSSVINSVVTELTQTAGDARYLQLVAGATLFGQLAFGGINGKITLAFRSIADRIIQGRTNGDLFLSPDIESTTQLAICVGGTDYVIPDSRTACTQSQAMYFALALGGS